MKLLMVYNFKTEESHVDAPNFYKSCAEKIFPKFGVETTYLPNLRSHLLFKLLTFLQIRDAHALMVVVTWWIFRNGKNFDVILGWLGNGVIAAVLKDIIHWPKTRVCLILYKLPDERENGLKSILKRLLIKSASRGADLLLALDKYQAESFARILQREPGSTCQLSYGVDTNWYDSQVKVLPHVVPKTVFCPGSAYRDESTFEKAIFDLDIVVKRYQLSSSSDCSATTMTIGKAIVKKYYNAPYASYIYDCQSSAVVVIAVANKDKPVGLTSLLECMSLGRPIIITKGASSRDYVIDGVTALLYEEGNWQELQEKIGYLLDNPEIAENIGTAAREYARTQYGLENTGKEFVQKIYNLDNKECLN